MDRTATVIAASSVLAMAAMACAQQSEAPAKADGIERDTMTIPGCLNGERGNYIVIEDGSSMIYALKGAGNKVGGYLHHTIEVKGRMLTGSIKTGVGEQKSGSNPSDTVHGIDGVPLQISDVHNDIRVISKHCKAADEE